MNIDLSGKSVLVTGASRGIGRAVARGLGDAGATVGVHYNAHGEEARALCAEIGPRAHPLQADLADPEAPGRLFAEALKVLGSVEVLVNNAGIALPSLTEPADLVPFIVLLASGLADHATGGTFDINAGSYVH